MNLSSLAFKALCLALLATSSAQADGFLCETLDGSLSIQAFNHIAPKRGTRRGSAIIFSDRTVKGLRTIARFESGEGERLKSYGSLYDIDLRDYDVSAPRPKLLRVDFRKIDLITLNVEFSYNSPVRAGQALRGLLTITRENGSKLRADLACTRYLKNPKPKARME